MITSFKCSDTKQLLHGQRVRRFINVEPVAVRKLQQLHAAITIKTLKVPPGNRLEALKGKRLGQYSIRINDQWRICFKFKNGHATEVEIVDYH